MGFKRSASHCWGQSASPDLTKPNHEVLDHRLFVVGSINIEAMGATLDIKVGLSWGFSTLFGSRSGYVYKRYICYDILISCHFMGQVQRTWEKDASFRWPNISSLVGMRQQEVAKRKLCHSNHPSDHTSKVNLASKTAESCRWMGERYHFKDMQSIFKSHANHIQQHLSHIKVAHLQLSSREFDMVPQYCTQFIPFLKVLCFAGYMTGIS